MCKEQRRPRLHHDFSARVHSHDGLLKDAPQRQLQNDRFKRGHDRSCRRWVLQMHACRKLEHNSSLWKTRAANLKRSEPQTERDHQMLEWCQVFRIIRRRFIFWSWVQQWFFQDQEIWNLRWLLLLWLRHCSRPSRLGQLWERLTDILGPLLQHRGRGLGQLKIQIQTAEKVPCFQKVRLRREHLFYWGQITDYISILTSKDGAPFQS